MIRIDIKPFSVNEAWKGKRYKTDKYKKYESDVLFLLPKIKLPEAPYKISFIFGMSNLASDWDNPCKLIQDILQKKYGFNDKNVFEAHILKKKVEKKKEYIEFKIETYFEKK